MPTNKKIAYYIIIASPLIIGLASVIFGRDGWSCWSLNPWLAFLISLSSVFAGTVLDTTNTEIKDAWESSE